LGTAAGAAVGVGASAACTVGTGGVCAPANPAIVAASAAVGGAIGAAADALAVHGNSSQSMRETEVYHLINNSTGVIDKIGITSNPAGRYSQAYLTTENVTYVTQSRYSWRYPAMVEENIRLTFYRFEHGELPRLNKGTR
jgi:hypothetical protein